MPIWRELIRLLFDNTSAREDMLEVEAILKEVLGAYTPQESFTDALNRVLEKRKKGSSFHRTPFFKQFLSRHRRREDYTSGYFTVARHVLEDLPKIYGIKPEDR